MHLAATGAISGDKKGGYQARDCLIPLFSLKMDVAALPFLPAPLEGI
jgi:hypothetical protein